MDTDRLPIIGISCGDLNGIGMEVIMKAFIDNQILDLCTPVLFATTKVTSYHRKALDMMDFNFQLANNLDELTTKKVNLVNSWSEQVNLEYGVNSKEVGTYALKSIDEALRAWKDQKIDALVTAPVNKNNITVPDGKFTGHTGYIGDKVGGEPLMILATDEIRVALVTGHVPISEVSNNLSKKLLTNRINQLHKSLVQDFGIRKPKIGVLGLNPHAGDNGLLGNEEQEIIEPVIKECFDKGMLVYGPYAADGYFGINTYKQFDATLAMYHDQGLIPFKTMAFEDGVNFTAGLELVRTSPDHGTGFDIAGKNLASEVSFRNAVYAAIDIVKKRNEYKNLTKNQLRKQDTSKISQA